MSSRLKTLILPAFALLFASIPAFSQVTGVEGIVKDEGGKPVQGAIVTFDRVDIKGHYTVKTDKKGPLYSCRPADGYVHRDGHHRR